MNAHARMPWMTVQKAAPEGGDAAEIRRLLALSSNLSKRLQAAFLESVEQAGRRVDTAAIVRLLRAGRVNDAIAVASRALTGANQSPLAEAITTAVEISGEAAVRYQMPAPVRAQFEFNVQNPATIKKLQRYQFRLIRELNDESRRAVARVIRAGVKAGQNPITTTQDVRDHIGLTERQSMAVRNYERMLREGDRTAFHRALHSKNFDQKALQILADRKPLPDALIKRMVDRYRFRFLRYRSQVISRTEALRAANTGNQTAWEQAVESGTVTEQQVMRRWIFTHDERTRHAHRLVPGMNPQGRGLHEYFETIDGPLLFPGDPAGPPEATIQCRCTLVYRIRSDV